MHHELDFFGGGSNIFVGTGRKIFFNELKWLKMEKAKSWIASIFLVALFCSSSVIAYAGHCTQNSMPCDKYPGYWLYCSGPVTGTQCWSGGCGGPVGPVSCQDDPQQ